MRARTLYNIIYTKVSAGASKALAALAVLLCAACSSHDVIEEIREIDVNGKDPLNFTCLAQNNEQEHTTRAATSLKSDFMVSTYKSYGTAKQQTVMDCYHVEYKTTGTDWDGNASANWDYTGIAGQYEKYWDYSAFPYRFHAVAPYTSNTPSEVSTLGDQSLKINAPYKMQTCTNGAVTPTDAVAEPYLIAQIQRNENGTDQDLISSTGSVNSTSTSKNRYVAMPFHHINSKIRFGVYHTTQWLTANKTYIENLSIKVTSANFVTKAQGYQATGNNSWRITTGNAGFYGLTQDATSGTAPDYHKILQFNGGDGLYDNDLTLCQTRETAFFLRCSDGIMQIPQEGVKMTVSFDLMNEDGTLNQGFTDVPIQLEYSISPGTYQDTFNWQAGILYTYYLVLGQIDHKLEITFTATLTPWEDVTGSLTTDLEQ